MIHFENLSEKFPNYFQLGIAIGFVLPPILVHMNAANFIADDLNRLFLISLVANTIIFLLIVFCEFFFFSIKSRKLAQRLHEHFKSNCF